jgi:hypothetical protein
MKHPVVVISYPTGWKLPIDKVTKIPILRCAIQRRTQLLFWTTKAINNTSLRVVLLLTCRFVPDPTCPNGAIPPFNFTEQNDVTHT